MQSGGHRWLVQKYHPHVCIIGGFRKVEIWMRLLKFVARKVQMRMRNKGIICPYSVVYNPNLTRFMIMKLKFDSILDSSWR